MKKVLVLVEGQTEEQFIKKVLQYDLGQKGIYLIPIIIRTKEVKTGPNYKGGFNSYSQAKSDLLKLLGDTSADVITTMLDYYGLPDDFPSFSTQNNCYQEVESAERAFAEDINHPKFIPYLQLHEFEGILFTSPDAISVTMDTSGNSINQLQRIRNNYTSPEEINDGVETHPSRRLEKIFPNYNKPFHGTLISTRIGIDQLTSNCPHFKQWIKSLLQSLLV